MLRDEDIVAIKTTLDDLTKKSDIIRLKKYEPTLNQIDQIYQEIYDYSKKNKLIIYGGWAQNKLIINKNKDDGFYNELSLADIEFYSYEPIKLGMDLAKLLYKKGYPYIQLTEGVHEETYKLFVNFHNFCDISYIPKYIYDNLPTINIDGFILTHPHFMMVDAFRVYSDPMFSFFRLEKTFSRFNKLLSYYPLYDPKKVKSNPRSIIKPIQDNIFKILKKHFVHNTDFIVVHHYSYNYLIKKTNRQELLSDIPYLSLISINYTKDVNRVFNILQKEFNNITFKEYYPFFQFLGRKTEYYLNEQLILVIYSHNERCTVYQATFSEAKKTLFGTFSLIRLMLIAEYYNQHIHKNFKQANEFMTLLQNLFSGRIDYLEEKEINVMDNSPFQEFTFECLGESIDPIRQSRLRVIQKLKMKQQVRFNFNPETNKDAKVPEYKFDNTSGNLIINPKDFTIKK